MIVFSRSHMTHTEALVEFEPLTLAEAHVICPDLQQYCSFLGAETHHYAVTDDDVIVSWVYWETFAGEAFYSYISLHHWDPKTKSWEWVI